MDEVEFLEEIILDIENLIEKEEILEEEVIKIETKMWKFMEEREYNLKTSIKEFYLILNFKRNIWYGKNVPSKAIKLELKILIIDIEEEINKHVNYVTVRAFRDELNKIIQKGHGNKKVETWSNRGRCSAKISYHEGTDCYII